MKSTSIPYFLVQSRIDVITKVPTWASEIFKKGDEVYRESSDSVIFGTKNIGLVNLIRDFLAIRLQNLINYVTIYISNVCRGKNSDFSSSASKMGS